MVLSSLNAHICNVATTKHANMPTQHRSLEHSTELQKTSEVNLVILFMIVGSGCVQLW